MISFLQFLFSFIAVVQMRTTIPRKVLWRVKSENLFILGDSTFHTEVAFTCASTFKNKI